MPSFCDHESLLYGFANLEKSQRPLALRSCTSPTPVVNIWPPCFSPPPYWFPNTPDPGLYSHLFSRLMLRFSNNRPKTCNFHADDRKMLIDARLVHV